jgi:hypothetical protein
MPKGSERQRTALRLKNEGQTYAQIGEYLGVSDTRACDLVRKAKAAGEVNTAAQRICNDPCAVAAGMEGVTCQRSAEHLGKHRWQGEIVTIEWQWHNPK